MSDTRANVTSTVSKEHLQKLWTNYNSKQVFSNADLDKFLDELKEKAGSTDVYIESVKEEFEKQLQHAHLVADKVLNRLTSKHGTLGDREILHIVKKYQDKYSLTNPMVNSIIKYVRDYRSADPNLSNKAFNFKPTKSNAIGLMLGQPKIKTVGSANIASEDMPYLKQIQKLHAEYQLLHSSVIDQTIRYKDCKFQELQRRYDSRDNSQHDAIHPLFVALFGPKIRSLDHHFLLPSLANIVKTRAEGGTPTSIVENGLLWDITHDNSTLPCTSDKSAMHDCLKRVRIQIALWECVHSLRNGNLFDSNNSNILSKLLDCNPNTYMAPDMLINGDEHQMLERLFSAFSFKRITMSTLPYMPNIDIGANQNPYQNPFHSQMLQASATEDVAIFTVRLPDLPDELVDTFNKSNLPPKIDLQHRLKFQDFFLDPHNQNVVPHNVKVEGASGVFVVYINRHKVSFNIHSVPQMRKPFHFEDLPLIDSSNRMANLYPVDVPDELHVGDLSRGLFKLKSMVSVAIPDDVENSLYKRQRPIIVGSETTVLSDGKIFTYNPVTATTAYDDDQQLTTKAGNKVFNQPITAMGATDIQKWHLEEKKLSLSKVLVYVDATDDLELKQEFGSRGF